MSPAHNERHHHHGCFLFLCFVGFLVVATTFSYTFFTCYDAEKTILKTKNELLIECALLCDTVPKFSIMASRYEMSLFYTNNKAKRARKDFYRKKSIADKAVAYYTLEDSLRIIASKLKNNRLAVKDVRWDDATKDLRNITNRVFAAQTNYAAAVKVYNKTLKGKMRELWLKVLDFEPAEQFEKPVLNTNQPKNSTK